MTAEKRHYIRRGKMPPYGFGKPNRSHFNALRGEFHEERWELSGIGRRLRTLRIIKMVREMVCHRCALGLMRQYRRVKNSLYYNSPPIP